MANNITFLIAPDYLPDYFSHWYLLGSHLQRESGCSLRLELPSSNTDMPAQLDAASAGLLYANAFLAESLIREHGWLPVARPAKQYDEVLVAVSAASDYRCAADLPADAVIKARTNCDIRQIGLRLLADAGADTSRIRIQDADTFAFIASALLKNEAQAGFFMSGIYHHLSKHSRENLRVLEESRFGSITHLAVLHPDHAEHQAALSQALCQMAEKPAAALILESLDLPGGFVPFTAGEAAAMVASVALPPAGGGTADPAETAAAEA